MSSWLSSGLAALNSNASGLAQGFGMLAQGFGQAQAYNSNASSERTNAQIINKQTATTVRQITQQAYQTGGTATAAYGGANLTAGGSAADVLRMNARNAATDIASVKEQGTLEALVHTQAADAADKAAKKAKGGGILGAIGGVVGAVFGGPGGASVGSSLGNALGSFL